VATWRFVLIDLPEAQTLADLASVEHDLRAAQSFCDMLIEARSRLNEERNETPANPELWEALTVAASVRYARAFAKDVRKNDWVDAVVGGLPREMVVYHRQFIEFGNKYIAHSVNQFEENRVVAYLMPEERGPRGVTSISVQHDRMSALSIEDMRRLEALCVEMSSRITSLIEAEKARVLEIARGLSVDDLYTRVDSPAEVPSWSCVNKPRARKHLGQSLQDARPGMTKNKRRGGKAPPN